MTQKTLIENIEPEFATRLVEWFKANARALPWRESIIPYRVWVSEIMLQQTRVNQVIGYYERFMERFPDIFALAGADGDEVIKYWEGLGYYSRAQNLHRAAKLIAAEYGGKFPGDYGSIRRLPGIGDYTAGTICAICFNLPVPSVDGNILRVVTRLTGSEADIADGATKTAVYKVLIPLYEAAKSCGALTESMMELGATVCVPNGKPLCAVCPVKDLCKAHRLNLTGKLPVKSAKPDKIPEDLTVFVVGSGGKYAVTKRPAQGLLAGLWEFPNLKGRLSEAEALAAAQGLGFFELVPRGTRDAAHIFTHRVWNMRVYYFACSEPSDNFTWSEIEKIALPTAFKKLVLMKSTPDTAGTRRL